MKKVLCDTNVFIKLFNDDVQTINNLANIGNPNILIPSVAVMELYAGMGNKQELSDMRKKLRFYNVVHLNQKCSRLAISFMHDYKLSHNMQIPDALIGAMAITYKIPLYTYNLKDFRFMPNIELYDFSSI
jgi:predicted nucleic acid-binding protein